MTTTHYVDNAALTAAVIEHQADPSRGTADVICQAVHRIADGYYAKYMRDGNCDDRADFAQDAAAKAIHWAMRFKPNKGGAFNYLTTCVQNHLRQHWQDRKRQARYLKQYAQHIRETTSC